MNRNVRSFSALYIKNYRLFISAQFLSLAGTWMHQAGQAWLIYELAHSPLYLGLLGTALSLPIMLFTLFGGLLADRFSKKSLLVLTQSMGIIPPVLLGILTVTGLVKVWHILLLAFLMGLITAIDLPIRQSFLIEMVGRGNLLNAISLHSAAFNGARMLGPAIAGLVIENLGVHWCFFLNAVSFVPIVLVLRSMTLSEQSRPKKSKGIIRDIKEGFGFILGRRDLSLVISTIMIFSLFGIPYHHFLAVYAEDILKIGAKGLGFLMSSSGLGAFTAALTLAFLGDVKNKRAYMSASGLLFSVFMISFSLSRITLLTVLCLFVAGWSLVSFLANANSIVQLSVDDHIRGRVMSVFSLFFLGMVPVGSLIIGTLADYIGTPVTLALSGFICLVAGMRFIKRVFHLS